MTEEDKSIVWPDITFPPVNLYVLQSAYNFYSSHSYNIEDIEESLNDYDQDS